MFPNRSFFNNNFLSKLKSTTLIPDYFFLLFGFFGGNLFSFIFSISPLSPIILIIGVVLSFEITSCLYYKSFIFYPLYRQFPLNLSAFFESTGTTKKSKRKTLKKRKVFFLIKLGLLFGLFVDAFKVGS